MNVYKIVDTVNGYYHYIVSQISDGSIVLEHQEHYSAHCPENPINLYYNTVVGWDNIMIEKVTDVKPIDVINGNYSADPKNMDTSDEYKKLLPPPKEPRVKKEPKEPKPKKEPKPRAKKAGKVSIDTEGSKVTFS